MTDSDIPCEVSSIENNKIVSSPKDEKVDRQKFTELGHEVDTVGDELIQWLNENRAQFPNLTLQQYAPEVRGVHSKINLDKNQVIVSIPKNCLITVEMGKATEIGKLLLQKRIDFVAPKHIFLMMFLLTDMEKEEESFFKFYYRTLPSTLNNMPIFWNEEELSWLKGSYILHQIKERKEAIKRDYDIICKVDPEFSRFTLERFSWARMIVCSRNFGMTIDGIKTAALVPFADMLNHYRPRETSWTFDQSLQSFTITTLRPIVSGHQVYDSYGKKCNHRFLLNYGFAVEDNIEEDGQNPNEVMTSFHFQNSDDIALLNRKRSYLHESGNYSMETRMSCRHSDNNTREGYSFARLIVATEDELFQLVRRSPAHAIPPFSSSMEIRVLELLKKIMIQQLNRYDTTLEEDNLLLKNKTYATFSNRCQALIFMRGEKQVCQHYISLADKMIPLLKLPWLECKTILKQYHTGDSDIDRYSQEVVAVVLAHEHRLNLLEEQRREKTSIPPPPNNTNGMTLPVKEMN